MLNFFYLLIKLLWHRFRIWRVNSANSGLTQKLFLSYSVIKLSTVKRWAVFFFFFFFFFFLLCFFKLFFFFVFFMNIFLFKFFLLMLNFFLFSYQTFMTWFRVWRVKPDFFFWFFFLINFFECSPQWNAELSFFFSFLLCFFNLFFFCFFKLFFLFFFFNEYFLCLIFFVNVKFFSI